MRASYFGLMRVDTAALFYGLLKRTSDKGPYINDVCTEGIAKSFYKRAVRHYSNASSTQNKLQRKLSRPKLATSREYKVQERES